MECWTNISFMKGGKIYICWIFGCFFFFKCVTSICEDTWMILVSQIFFFRDLFFFISYSSMMRSFITLLVVGTFLFACDGCPVVLQSSPCLCSCYDLLTLCQNRCNAMTDSGRRSRCMSSCAEYYKSCNRSCLPLPG